MKRTREESDAPPPSSPPSRLPFILNPVSGATSESVRRQVLALVYGNKRACLPCTHLCTLCVWTLSSLLWRPLTFLLLSNPHFYEQLFSPLLQSLPPPPWSSLAHSP